jgi:hypothetical protein
MQAMEGVAVIAAGGDGLAWISTLRTARSGSVWVLHVVISL